ncbi:UDP-N-acetylglucosamine--N-acetylmuramyl-(pentapeptide) pyrophosphoryl-undecaprenol N-acetylglucosamine transferase [Symbioplanes lichenis]|uniref:UDP-N-acetylglucosamine--N-acetylmuramyl- (pentapeptide) pyrophosphoryl-undecaprenol N-acetylglucosamine transferase n=1 Tax=Symbioplanes lichenis TaxID=1629072 RepID=UPI00273A1F25|nr:UDP-N-acetylglucosamine--N-acetylmuramyl-(pentapeptide) pyrophosphoryl-undecaprenol N-acetylglucosamine transferase [Actinoplanes lichenis]
MALLRSVVLAGGGTGGHIYPLLAFADALRRHFPEVRITTLGSPKGMENDLIPPAGYDLRVIPAFQLPRAINLDLLRTPDRMYKSAHAAGLIVDEVGADVVVGFGGYVSVPAYLAAWRRDLPIVIHEVNVPPGVANRMGMRFTKNVAVGFPGQPEAVESLKDARVVGVPLRTALTRMDRAALRPQALQHFGLRPDLPVLFVSGGSSGARSINLAVAAAAKKITHAGVQVLHVQGGRNDPFEVPGDLPVPYVVVPYLSDMELGYAAADLMLCRGGAITVAETTALGMPAVYVPYPHSNQEQKRNALPVVESGGGLLVDDGEMTPEWVERTIIPLALDSSQLATMGAAAAGQGRRDGDEALLDFVCEAVAASR